MKRGQAAIEFLSTYGWMLFVVLAVITSLVYFDVLSPDRFLVPHCTIPSGIGCTDFLGASDGIDLVFRNTLGFDILNITTRLEGRGCAVNGSGQTLLLNGEARTYWFNCSLPPGKFQGRLTINYVSAETLNTHQKIGDVIVDMP